MKKIVAIIAFLLVSTLLFSACAPKPTQLTSAETTATTAEPTVKASYRYEEGTDGSTKVVAVYDSMPTTRGNYPTDHKLIRFTLNNGGTFVVETYPEYAPETCDNFVKLVSEGFYDGLGFHRMADLTGNGGYILQGGDPNGNGTGGSENKIRGEFRDNGFTQNTMVHERGVISMARSNHPDSASSQFFICYDTIPHLDGQYAAFAKVTEGMETLDALLEGEFNGSVPVNPIVIVKAEVIG